MDRKETAEAIIRNHVLWAMGAGLIPIVVADVFAVSSLQLDMIRQLCRTYEIHFEEVQGKSVIATLTGSTLARIGAEGLKLIPGVGTILGGAAASVLSGATTYAIGEMFKKHFESGGDLVGFEPDKMKQVFAELLEKGKQKAIQLKSLTDKPDEKDKLDKIASLIEMKNSGYLTAAEFDALKKKVVDD